MVNTTRGYLPFTKRSGEPVHVPYLALKSPKDVEDEIGKPVSVSNEDNGTETRLYKFDYYSSTLTVTYINAVAKKFVIVMPIDREFKLFKRFLSSGQYSPDFAVAAATRLGIQAKELTLLPEATGKDRWKGTYNDTVFEEVAVSVNETSVIATASVQGKIKPKPDDPLAENYFSSYLRAAIKRGDINDVAYSIKYYPPVLKAVTHEFGGTPLTYAVRQGEVEVAKYLIEKGLKLTKDDKSQVLNYTHDADLTKFFIQHGAIVNNSNQGRMTPLHSAAMNGRADTVRLLIAHGAKVGAKDKYGNTPMHYAASNGAREVAMILKANGADPKLRNNYGMTPFMLALSQGQSAASQADFMIDLGGGIDAQTIPVTKAEKSLLGTWSSAYGNKVSELTFIPGGILIHAEFTGVVGGQLSIGGVFSKSWRLINGHLVANLDGITITSSKAYKYAVAGKNLTVFLNSKQVILLSRSRPKVPRLVDGRRYGLVNMPLY